MVNIVNQVDDCVRIERVLVSVSDKRGLEELIPGLLGINPAVQFFSTGGTYRAIVQILGETEASSHVTQISDYTGQPETQGGLVKTLDFKIYLGLLTETYNPSHQADLARISSRATSRSLDAGQKVRSAQSNSHATLSSPRRPVSEQSPI